MTRASTTDTAVFDPAWLDHALGVARRAAAAAARVIASHYRSELAVEIKPDATPVTLADIDSERAIREVLGAAFPEHAIYGEEQGRSGDSDFLWLVDPIDGTKGFVRRYPMFSTQIALMHRGQLVLGVSAAAEYGETMWARRGGGAWFDGPGATGAPVRVADTAEIEQAALSTGNLKSLAGGRGWQALGALVGRLQRIRGYGDFLHYHLLARGCIDAVVESDVNILDIAALAVIVREAGGVFSDLDGAELDLDTRSVLAATPALHRLLQPMFRGWRDA
jgi:histidinol-phosphatase